LETSASFRRLLLERWPGRLLLGSLAVKTVVWLLELAAGENGLFDLLNTLARLGLVVSLVYFTWRLFQFARRHFLWRVRRRLIISYIFIGVVPALLLMAFSLVGGALMFFNVSAYLFKTGVDKIVEDARVSAQAAADEIQRGRGPTAIGPSVEALSRRADNAQRRYPGLSVVLVPRATSSDPPAVAKATTDAAAIKAGDWSHMAPPSMIPAWVSAAGFGGLLAYTPADDPEDLRFVIRAVAFPTPTNPTWGVVVDIPVDEQVLGLLHEGTGIEPGAISLVDPEDDRVQPLLGRTRAEQAEQAVSSTPTMAQVQTPSGSKWMLSWAMFLDFADWATGRAHTASMAIRVSARDIYQRISVAQARLLGRTIGELSLVMLGFLAFLFLIIEFAAFMMGFTLARSITRSIHALFDGTERVRLGDFTHRIEVKDRDQLGELAESFNAMTANIEDLLQQAQEKRRLEEELRIAREIQMSLLPRGAMHIAGLSMSALCVPAREVGGDYYDFFPVDSLRIGLLIADVAGKGTSAALYMAELKGLVLSLSKIYRSPRQLLIEVNRILSDNLDRRSFITMTYVMIDLGTRTLTYARAGHTPLIFLPASNGIPRVAQVLVPNGMIVGLQLDDTGTHFESLLEEVTVPFGTGDVFVLYTDGVTEAMNVDSDLFGDDRLKEIIEEHGDLPSEQLRERIVREVEAFVGDADQHDDMTMILLKVEEQPVMAATVEVLA
jgi:sigma-B regulation protein RsbU (phosphoserine phosphatase)